MAVESAIRDAHHPLRWGAVIGLLCAAEFFLTEEILALFVVAVGSAVIIAAVLFPRAAVQRALPLARALGIAVVVLLLLPALPLAYQLFGPGRIVGPIQTPNTYVTDVLNLVVPTSATALAPPFTTAIVNQWSGFPIEADAYIGIPLLLVGLYTAVRCWGTGGCGWSRWGPARPSSGAWGRTCTSPASPTTWCRCPAGCSPCCRSPPTCFQLDSTSSSTSVSPPWWRCSWIGRC
jgi:hypothetical protein